MKNANAFVVSFPTIAIRQENNFDYRHQETSSFTAAIWQLALGTRRGGGNLDTFPSIIKFHKFFFAFNFFFLFWVEKMSLFYSLLRL